jgi:hypothetical protein
LQTIVGSRVSIVFVSTSWSLARVPGPLSYADPQTTLLVAYTPEVPSSGDGEVAGERRFLDKSLPLRGL